MSLQTRGSGLIILRYSIGGILLKDLQFQGTLKTNKGPWKADMKRDNLERIHPTKSNVFNSPIDVDYGPPIQIVIQP